MIFCLAQFLDIFNLSAAVASIATIAGDLHMNENEPVWIVSALQLTLSAFLLVVSTEAYYFIKLSLIYYLRVAA